MKESRESEESIRDQVMTFKVIDVTSHWASLFRIFRTSNANATIWEASIQLMCHVKTIPIQTLSVVERAYVYFYV